MISDMRGKLQRKMLEGSSHIFRIKDKIKPQLQDRVPKNLNHQVCFLS
jgi:hypothetical protein